MGARNGPAVVAAARAGDPAALAAVRTAGTMLGRGIATLTMLLNPEMIVLGTLAVHAGDLLLPEIEREVAARTWSRLRTGLRIVPAALIERIMSLGEDEAVVRKFFLQMIDHLSKLTAQERDV